MILSFYYHPILPNLGGFFSSLDMESSLLAVFFLSLVFPLQICSSKSIYSNNLSSRIEVGTALCTKEWFCDVKCNPENSKICWLCDTYIQIPTTVKEIPNRSCIWIFQAISIVMYSSRITDLRCSFCLHSS